MNSAIKPYTGILVPWICVAVYLWVLELRAAIGTDSEPVIAWLADISAILLTIVFWVVVACLPLAITGELIGRLRMCRINRIAVKVCLVGVTAMHFVRWLLNWQWLAPGYDIVLIALVGASVGLSIRVLALRARNRDRQETGRNLPDLEDCFAFGALPLLLAAIGAIVVQIVFVHSPGQRYASPEALKPRTESAFQSPVNVILIISDAIRASSMSLYGYTRRTTPYLERWAESATVYRKAHTNSTSTKPSMTSIFTGKHPLSHGRLTKAQPPARSHENLLRLLRDHGYWIEAVTSNEDASLRLLGFAKYLSNNEHTAFQYLTLAWLRRMGVYPTPTGGRIYQSLSQFLWFLGYPQRTSYYGKADDTLKIASEVVRRARRPFFLAIQLHEPHDPYDAPPPFRGSYGATPPIEFPRNISSSHYASYDPRLQPDVNFYRDRYEESIRFLDDRLGQFLLDTDKFLAGEKYLLVFTGDHGESFERGFMNHGEALFESSTQVPLVIRFPDQYRGVKFSGLAQSIDVAPTILTAAGVVVPPWMDGRALFSHKSPETETTVTLNFKDPAGQNIYPLPTQIAIWSGRHKLILACESGRTMLYNLADDPDETTDLSKTLPTVLRDLKASLKSKLDRQSNGPKVPCALSDR